MSAPPLLSPPAPPPPAVYGRPAPTPSSPTPRDIGLTIAATVVVIALAITGIVAIAGRDTRYASRWDERVLPLVQFVEQARGHRFRHPIHVEFLSADAYREATTGDSGSSTDKAYYRDQARLLRALGLLEGEVDLEAETTEIGDSGTLAFYRPTTKTVYVRGTELTPSLRLTLVHELTHALQDQLFDLEADVATDGEAFAQRAVAEGDATRIEEEYYFSLSDDEQQAIDTQHDADVAGSKALNTSQAPVLLALFGAPYDLGAPFVRALADGDGGPDRAFRQPPRSEEQIFDLLAYLDHDAAQPVAAPDTDERATPIYSQGTSVGAVTWYVMLATRIDPQQALRATVGWGGDALSVYETDDELCATLVFVGDTQSDTDEMAGALTAMARTMPQNQPEVTTKGQRTQLVVCDPGADAAIPSIDLQTVFDLPIFRTIVAGSLAGDLDVAQLRCVLGNFDALYDSATISDLLRADDVDPLIDTFRSDREHLVRLCR